MKFSIVMPIYNSADKVAKSIESILNQTYSNLELIIVDDGSTDNSYDVCEKYAILDERVKLFHQENSGPGFARNYGVSKCSGHYIAFLDSDDYYELNFLYEVNNVIKKEDSDFVFISTINELPDGKVNYCDELYNFKKYKKDELINFQMSGMIPWGPCSKVVKSDLVKSCQFSNLNVGEEAIYSFDLIRQANKISFVKKPMYHYVHNENGQHKKGGIDPWWNLLVNYRNHLNIEKLLECYNDAFSCLVINSLIISIYRISINNNFFASYKSIKTQVKKYKEEFNVEQKKYVYLNNNNKIIFKLINYHFYVLLIVLSKVRNLFFNRGM